MKDVHTERYNDADLVPLTAHQAAGELVARDWGEGYSIGYVGEAPAVTVHIQRTTDRATVYMFQVRANDGSRFAVYSDRYGNVGRCEGRRALSWLYRRGIEAYVPCDD